jgi:hypothetical protein
VVLERIKKDLAFLAGPECAGRASGGKEIDKAADYVAAAFKAAGLKPEGKDGSYFTPFSVVGRVAPVEPTSLKLNGPDGQFLSLKLGSQFAVTSQSGQGKTEGGLVFAGYGITSEKPAYDDYKGIDAKDKVVLIIRRTPQFNAKENPFGAEGGEAASLNSKVSNAIKHGAKGILFVSDKSLAETNDPLIDFANVGLNKIPVLHVKRYIADHLLLSSCDKTLSQIEDAIDKDLTPRSLALEKWSLATEVVVKRQDLPCKNVVGVLDGAGPLADETVVIGAHYDHVGDGMFGSLLGAAGRGKIHYGADDNASGTTGLIELARRYGAMKDRQGRRIVFIAFSAEERGLFGSKDYCANPLFPLEKTAIMLNMDMIGRAAIVEENGQKLPRLLIYGTGTGEGIDKLVDEKTKKYPFKYIIAPGGTGPSDHDSFYRKQVPVIFYFTGSHPDYHRPTDTPEKINYEGLSMVVDLVQDCTNHYLTLKERPKYLVTRERFRDPTEAPRSAGSGAGRGNSPVLGIMPGNYEEEGKGVKVDGVSPGGAAEKAGIKAGDFIIEIAGKPVKDIGAYMATMGTLTAGKEVEVVIVRDKEQKKLKVTPISPNAK